MDDANRIRVAEIILEIRAMQAQLRLRAEDEPILEPKNTLGFVVDDLNRAVEYLVKAVSRRR